MGFNSPGLPAGRQASVPGRGSKDPSLRFKILYEPSPITVPHYHPLLVYYPLYFLLKSLGVLKITSPGHEVINLKNSQKIIYGV